MPGFFGLDVIELIQAVGYLGLFAIVFVESGVFIGFFLPGDSLLLSAGILASKNFLNILYLIPLLAAGAIAGDSMGYWTGKKYGKRLFEKPDSRFFKKGMLARAQDFYEKHGGKTIVLARFMPVVRTFAPIVAGMTEMKYRRFLFFNIIGGVFWVVALTLIGYFLGSLIADIEYYIIPAVAIIIAISFLPALVHVLRKNETGVPPL